MNEKRLFLITTSDMGDFYVIANDPTEAEQKVNEELSSSRYSAAYATVSIKVLAVKRNYDNGGYLLT